MKRFIAMLNDSDGKYINIPADKMELKDDLILAYNNGQLVACVDVGITLCAHLSEITNYKGEG